MSASNTTVISIPEDSPESDETSNTQTPNYITTIPPTLFPIHKQTNAGAMVPTIGTSETPRSPIPSPWTVLPMSKDLNPPVASPQMEPHTILLPIEEEIPGTSSSTIVSPWIIIPIAKNLSKSSKQPKSDLSTTSVSISPGFDSVTFERETSEDEESKTLDQVQVVKDESVDTMTEDSIPSLTGEAIGDNGLRDIRDSGSVINALTENHNQILLALDVRPERDTVVQAEDEDGIAGESPIDISNSKENTIVIQNESPINGEENPHEVSSEEEDPPKSPKTTGESPLDILDAEISPPPEVSNGQVLIVFWIRVKRNFIVFWNWSPSEELQKTWWWSMIRRSKIPGLKDAVTKEKIHVMLRIFWVSAFIATIILCIKMIMISAGDFSTNPILFEWSAISKFIWQIATVAVTVGKGYNLQPGTLKEIEKMKLDLKYSDNHSVIVNGTPWNSTELQLLEIVAATECKFQLSILNGKIDQTLIPVNFPENGTQFLDNVNNTIIRDKIQPFLQQRRTTCKEIITRCRLNGVDDDDCDMFQDSITDVGDSCQFNAMPGKLLRRHLTIRSLFESFKEGVQSKAWESWNIDKEPFVRLENSSRTVPESQRRYGEESGLRFVLIFPKRDDSKSCRQEDVIGYPIFLHSSLNEPKPGTKTTILQSRYIYRISVTPKTTIANPEIRSVDREKRGCIFSDEERLNYFTKYTLENCVAECIADYVFEGCKCSPFNDPKDGNRPMCISEEQHICVLNQREKYYNNPKSMLCSKCLPGCNENDYEVSVTATPYDPDNLPPQIADDENLVGVDTALVYIFIAKPTVATATRKLRYSGGDKFGVIGGILGLTNAMSVIDCLRIAVALLGLVVPMKILMEIVWELTKHVWRCMSCDKDPSEEEQSTQTASSHSIHNP